MNLKLEGLHSKVPVGYSAVCVLHPLQPRQGLVVRFQNEQFSQEESFDSQAFLFHSRIAGLPGVELPTYEFNGMAIL